MAGEIEIEPDEEKFVLCHGDRHDWDFQDPRRGGMLQVHERVRKVLKLLKREVDCRNCGTVRTTIFTCDATGGNREQYGPHKYDYPKGYLSSDHPGRGVVQRGDWAYLRTQSIPLSLNGHGG